MANEVKKLLDTEALRAIKTYVDTYSGKVDDVQIKVGQGAAESIVSNKIATIPVTDTYNADGTTIVDGRAIAAALGTLDVPSSGTGAITGFGTGKTLSSLYETDGKIAATFQNIQITESQVTDLTTHLSNKQPLDADLTAIAAISGTGFLKRTGDNTWALDTLTGAMTFVGVSTTDPTSSSGATVEGHSTWKKGEVVIYKRSGESGYEEYIATANDNSHWEILGDADSYALKTVTISAGSGLSGGGTLEANRTISHAVPSGAATKTSGFYKFSTDGFGHVNGTTAVAKSDLTGLGVADDSLVLHNTGDEAFTGIKSASANGSDPGGVTATKVAPSVTSTYGVTTEGLWAYNDYNSGTGHIINKTTFNYNGIDINLTGATGDYHYALTFPLKNGTLAVTDDITLTGVQIGGSDLTITNKKVNIITNSTYNASTNKIATMSDIPSLSGYVTGSSLTSDNIIIGNGGSAVKDSGIAKSRIPTTTEKSNWNASVYDIKVIQTGSENDLYQKIQKSVCSATTTYSDVITTCSYNDAWTILTTNA